MMRRQKFAVAALLASLVLTASACEEGLTEANENPNAPTEVGPQFLLPQAIRFAVEQTFGAGQMLSHTAIWPQHAVQLQYPDEEGGMVRADRMQAYWDNFYAGPLNDVNQVVDMGKAANKPNVEAVGLIWKSWTFHIVTDLWGDVPYTEALQGGQGKTTPAYDAQKAIYTGLLQTLAAAQGKLTAGGAGFGSGDILYGNDFAAWRRFANSLRMRLAMRMSEVDAAAARTEFVAAYNAGGFTSNAHNAILRWQGAPYQNPLYEDWTGRDDHGISATMVDTLASLKDPRLEFYAEPAKADGKFRGLKNGIITPPLSIANYSRIGNFWRANGAASPTVLMSYAEVLLLQAEAANRGWIAGSAAALYEAGIRASMNQYDAFSPANAPTDAEIEAYLAQPAVVYNAATGLRQIQLQAWIALYMNGNEAWSQWRRTGVPALVKGPDMATSRIPVRFSYPGNEQSLNSASLAAAVQRQGGGNDLTTKLWWQKN